MGLFKKSNETEIQEINYTCRNCGKDFTKTISDSRKTIYPGFANSQMVYYFADCPNCGKQAAKEIK